MKAFRVLMVLLLALIALPASAQVVTSSTGAINGVVSDTSKAVLPGVTVTAQSAQMMGTREAVSDEQGRYQFAAIPPGEYTVTFELTGFSKYVRENIRISLGFTGTVNAEMQLATQQETITVTGQSPVVDTTATKLTNNFDAQTMSNLPTTRDFPALMSETPGVAMTRIDVGGSVAMTEVGFVIYGMSSGNYMRTEGIVAPSLTNLYNDFGAFEEAQIETAAHTAEMPFAGLYSNTIAKSGGNTYHGNFYKDYENKRFGATNIDAAQIAAGIKGGTNVAAQDVNKVTDYQDTNFDIGGYLMKDKLWFYGSVRDTRSHVNFVSLPEALVETKVFSTQTKWTYNLTNNHKFIYYYNLNQKRLPNHFTNTSNFYSPNSTDDEIFPIGQTKIEYNVVLSPKMFLEVRAGKYFKTFEIYSKPPVGLRYEDTATKVIVGSVSARKQRDLRPQTNGSMSYYKSDWAGRSHNFKVGWEIAQYQDPIESRGLFTEKDGASSVPNITYTLNNGAPSQVKFTYTPSFSFTYQWTYSAYLNDSWQLNDRLSFNLGIRWDRYRNGYPAQDGPVNQFTGEPATHFTEVADVVSQSSFGPRLGMVWNVRGDGKTVVKGNFATYPTRMSGTLGNPNPGDWSKTFAWTDSNRDLLWQPGEEGRLVTQVGGTSNSLIDPNWKQPQTAELALWMERELVANFGIRTGFVYRSNKNNTVSLNPNRPLSAFNIARTVPDPGPDGRVGTADDASPITVYDLAPAALALPILSLTTHDTYNPTDENYKTWEISGTKRMTNHWSLNASFTETWAAAGQSSRGLGTTGPNPLNPNQFLGAESDSLFHYTTSQFKVTSAFQLPYDVRVSEVVRSQGGQPFGRTIAVTMNYGLETIQVEPTSARRQANITLLDAHAEKGLSFGKRRLALVFDVFNLLNTNAALAINGSSSATFLNPTAIVPPRIARFATKFEF